MVFIRVKRIKSIKSIKNTKCQNVKQANKNKNNNYGHKTSKRKKITMRIKHLRGRKSLAWLFMLFMLVKLLLITSFTVLLMYTIEFLIITMLFNYHNLFRLSQSTCMLQLNFQSLQSFSIITIFFDYHNLLVCYNWIFNHYNPFRVSQFACMINGNLTWLFTCDFNYSWTTINDVIDVPYREFSVIKLNQTKKKLTTVCNDEKFNESKYYIKNSSVL